MGVSGILRPNGVFVPCSYKNHGEAASKIPPEEGEYCIYLSSGMETLNSQEASIIYFNDVIYKQQVQWFRKHFLELDNVQKKQFMEYMISKKNA